MRSPTSNVTFILFAEQIRLAWQYYLNYFFTSRGQGSKKEKMLDRSPLDKSPCLDAVVDIMQLTEFTYIFASEDLHTP